VRESDLYLPVRDWLLRQGWVVHVEVFEADIVATLGDKLMAVELKLGFTKSLRRQVEHRAHWADYVVAAIPGSRGGPCRFAPFCRFYGFGLLLVDGDKIHKAVGFKPQPWGWRKRHDYRVKKLTGRAPAMDHEVAGLPSCPALSEQRRLRNVTTEAP
jgi:hypothetical protein